MTAHGNRDRISYDEQAHVFESRAGLPEETARSIAAAVCDCAGLSTGDLIVEIGAGTGVIGRWLARSPHRYIGFDDSEPMLDVFRPRLDRDGDALAGLDATLLYADAESRWPVDDGTAAAIFGSRVLHLLDAEHVLDESERVARADGTMLICGRIERDPGSPRSTARKRMRELLAAHGLQPRPSGGRPTELLACAEARGARVLAPRVAAAWTDTVRVTEVIDAWRRKVSLGGVNPSADVAAKVLAALDEWAADTYGDPPAAVSTETRYVLDGIGLRVRSRAPDTDRARAPNRQFTKGEST